MDVGWGGEPRVEYVIVSYGQEIELLRLQMISIARRHDPAGLERLHVLNNDRDPDGFERLFEERVRPVLGWLGDRVSLARADALRPGLSGSAAPGWSRQQVLKLLAHRLVRTPVYVTLDTKNLLVRPCRAACYRTPEGRLRVGRRKPFPAMTNSYAFLGLPPETMPETVTAITTPYPLLTEEVAALCAVLEGRSPDLATLFSSAEGGMFEYALYQAWLAKRGKAALYDLMAPPLGVMFRPPAGVPPEELQRRLDFAARHEAPWFGFHRLTGHAGPEVRERVASLWQELGLVASVEEGLGVLRAVAGPTRQLPGR